MAMCRLWMPTVIFCCLSLVLPIYSNHTTHHAFIGDATSESNISTTRLEDLDEEVLAELGNDEHSHEAHQECELAVASIEWASVQNSMIIASFLFFSAITKIGFHHAGYLVTKIPESCLLIVLGTVAGVIFTFGTNAETFPEDLKKLEPHMFFLVLLPPIVLEASYSLRDRVFLDNLGTILVFAVIGTIVSFAIIGPILYLLSTAGALPSGHQISFLQCMLFASIIVAVDPVAVLAIFQEVGVNSVLYFIVFGESLLNDAVTVVLYHTIEGMNCYNEEYEEITPTLYVIAFFKFFTSSLGGISIGIVFGTITALLTKHTVETRVVEPLVMFSLSYLSYITSELFGFSGIIGLTVCGLLQAQYAFHNISHKSYVTVKYFTKMASGASDCVIFLYLGINLVRIDHQFHAGFIAVTILLTLISRFIVTYGLSAIMNRSRVRQISKREQFIMAYGGLRGAVAFSLVSLLEGKLEQQTQFMFMTTILVVIIFTVFIQGGTIKPLVTLLDIRTKEKQEQLMLFDELNANITDHVMAGIEEIIGNHGRFFFYDWFIHLDDKYIKHILQRNPMRKDEKIMKLYEKIALKQHFATLRGTEAAENFEGGAAGNLEDEGAMVERMSASTGLVGDGRRAARPSLLSQLTRYGNIEEPEHVDDIAYITPEMLEDEELTAVQQRKLSRQKNIGSEDLKDAQQLRMLLTKPGSSMDAREIRSKVDMDDRSNLMFLLQEKNKRLERFKRSLSNVGNESLIFPNNASTAMATIPEGPSGQIVRKSMLGRLGSTAGIERQSRLTTRRVIRSEEDDSMTRSRNNRISLERKNSDQMDGANRNQHNRLSNDSVFYSGPEEIELALYPKASTNDGPQAMGGCLEDIERGEGLPLATSSQEATDQLLPVVELSEKDSEESLSKRGAAINNQPEAAEAESNKDQAETDHLLSSSPKD
ncbi:Na(+)/H(+) exchanger beta-like [Watersipora subatra]|uniref:Na(+)/H(+) exchanger beta-like n=1 Tax=Watersipora subatra TaxID=2589382 RepID=UPI00355B7F10